MVQFHVSDDGITLDVTWEDILWQFCLIVVLQSSTYKIVKVINLLKTCLKGFWEIFYDNYNLLL